MQYAFANWLLRSRPFLFYPPVIAVMLWWVTSHVQHGGDGTVAWMYAVGLVLWTLLEWTLHRAMHIETKSVWVRRIQDTAHLQHHRAPDDLEHSVVRLSAGIPISLFILLVAFLCLGDVGRSMMLLCGVLTGYLFYEFVHLTSHARRRIPGLRYLHRYHLRHHFERQDRCYGVTSPLWDWVFHTMPSPRHSRSRA